MGHRLTQIKRILVFHLCASVPHLWLTFFFPHKIRNLPPPRKAAGSGARVGCEPGQVRKGAALSSTGLVPPVPRSPSAAAVLFAEAVRRRKSATNACRPA